jgi:hypothetical protein
VYDVRTLPIADPYRRRSVGTLTRPSPTTASFC